jgi:hypothetical protein
MILLLLFQTQGILLLFGVFVHGSVTTRRFVIPVTAAADAAAAAAVMVRYKVYNQILCSTKCTVATARFPR